MRTVEYPKKYIFALGHGIHVHRIVAERALGRPLPNGAVVHHVDGDVKNNVGSNLVICPSQAYHKLLHKRADAMEAIGNPNWLKCVICKKYDDPINIKISRDQRKSYHRKCSLEYSRSRRPFGKPHGNIGKKRTPEQLEKWRLASTGRKHSPESIEHMRQAAFIREAKKRVT